LVSLRWRLTTFPDLGKDQADALETVASVEDRAVSDVIRAAIAEHIDVENRRQDPGFQAGLKERIARAHKLLGD
jgi:predicted transcriptional regulator